MALDFVAIGDTVVDEFITLKDARVHCDVNDENCTLTMNWGDKIPYESAVTVAGVGNAANAAVAAARLGLSTAFVSNVGKDRYGEEIIATLAREQVETAHIRAHEGIPTNHHYVLRYEGERTILIRHERYPYRMPDDLAAPAWIYLSSVGEGADAFHDEVAAWVAAHRGVKLAFQPGTFQIRLGKDRLKALYAVTELVACNKEEAERILGVPSTPLPELLKQMRALGPRVALITDGPKGAYVSDGTEILSIPMYPDPKPPVDRTGAGDATTSTFVAALALGKTVREALMWGPVNSMSVVQEIGAQKGLLSLEALQQYLRLAPPEYQVRGV